MEKESFVKSEIIKENRVFRKEAFKPTQYKNKVERRNEQMKMFAKIKKASVKIDL